MTSKTQRIDLTTAAYPTFIDITREVEEAVAAAGIKDGVAVVASPHTTCSVLIQEDSERELDANATERLMADLIDVLEPIIPTCRYEGQYRHPGPAFMNTLTTDKPEEKQWALNTDAHLRSMIMGRSETITVLDGRPQLGEFGHIYFADFDRTRQRTRSVFVSVLGD